MAMAEGSGHAKKAREIYTDTIGSSSENPLGLTLHRSWECEGWLVSIQWTGKWGLDHTKLYKTRKNRTRSKEAGSVVGMGRNIRNHQNREPLNEARKILFLVFGGYGW